MNLKNSLQKYNSMKDSMMSNYHIMENSVNQGKILLNNCKKSNENLKKKIFDLEKNEKELNYKLIESNQKIKSLYNNINTKQIQNNNPNEEINKLKEIIKYLFLI